MTPTGLTEDEDCCPPELTHAALFVRFLRFGLLAFGGPVAQIAMIRRALVEEERWIGGAQFNRLLAVMQMLPGPEAHELCVHLGVRAKGRLGGLLAGLGFMAPGVLLMLCLAWLYTRLPIGGTWLEAVFLGVQAAVLAVIAMALHRIGKHILTDLKLWAVALGSAAASFAGASFWIILPVAGVAFVLAGVRRAGVLVPLLIALAVLAAWLLASSMNEPMPSEQEMPSVATLFVAGLKAGLLTFGGAYTAIPFVRDASVGRGWMSDAQFLDGVALAGIIPAPLVVFATFAGFVSGGLGGALAITAGIFLPAFAFSLLFYERLESLAEHPRLQDLLAGVAAAVVGLIGVTLVDLAGAASERSPNVVVSSVIILVALLLVARWRNVAAPLALALGAAIGLAAFR
jgi:chromate transporter